MKKTKEEQLPAVVKEEYKLPTLEDVYALRRVDNNELAMLLNNEPQKEWIINRQIGKVNVKYISIGIIEDLLTLIFKQGRVEILESKILANSLAVTVRLYVRNPVSGLLDMGHDGVGAVPIQLKSGAEPSDVSKLQSNSIQLGLPSAKSYAIKDAAEHFGKVFGKDLNRDKGLNVKDIIGFAVDMEYNPEKKKKQQQIKMSVLLETIKKATNMTTIEVIEKRIKGKEIIDDYDEVITDENILNNIEVDIENKKQELLDKTIN